MSFVEVLVNFERVCFVIQIRVEGAVDGRQPGTGDVYYGTMHLCDEADFYCAVRWAVHPDFPPVASSHSYCTAACEFSRGRITQMCHTVPERRSELQSALGLPIRAPGAIGRHSAWENLIPSPHAVPRELQKFPSACRRRLVKVTSRKSAVESASTVAFPRLQLCSPPYFRSTLLLLTPARPDHVCLRLRMEDRSGDAVPVVQERNL